MFENLDIFVYSGTGNTYKVAQCIGETAEAMGTTCDIGMIDIHSRPQEYRPSPDCLLGLMAPTLGTIQPISFFRFILGLPKGNQQKVFLASTGAWTKIGPIFIAGYVGLGLYLAALILLLKGYRVVGITGFGMPHNWTALIPPYWKKLENRIHEEMPITAGAFAKDILSGKRIYRRIIDLMISLLILPLPILFILLGHLFLAKTMFAGTSCLGCGQCAANCPRKAIKMYGKKQKRPYWTYRCEQCMRCVGYCPQKAVDCNTFLVAAYALLFCAVPMELLIAKVLSMVTILGQLQRNPFLLFVIYYIVVLVMGAVIYAVFYLLGRTPVFNKLFTCLSFTHYWRKYRNPDIGVEVLTKESR